MSNTWDPPTMQHPVAQPPKSQRWRTIGIVVAALVGAVLFEVVRSSDAFDGCERVEYRASSSDGPLHVYIRNATGESEETDRADGRYSRTFDCFKSSLLSLQVGADSGTVKCEIRRDGEIVAKATSTGEYPDARCLD